jgi:hypothetical protein
VLWNGHDNVTSLDNDLRRLVGGWSNSIGGYASPSFASELGLDRVGVVINADTPSETVIALPPGSHGRQRARCLPLSPVRGERGSE